MTARMLRSYGAARSVATIATRATGTKVGSKSCQSCTPSAGAIGGGRRSRAVHSACAAHNALLCAAADELRANSTLKSSEFSVPVLGLIFLKFAEVRFVKAERELAVQPQTGRRATGPVDYK